MSKDYFIKDSGISAYTINAFVEAIVEATEAGYEINYDSARRISTSFCVNFKQAQEEPTVETQAPAQEETPESPAQPEATAEESSEQSEGESDESSVEAVPTDVTPVFQGNERPFTLKDIEQAKDSMNELNKLGEPVGVSARSKREMVKLLKEYIGA